MYHAYLDASALVKRYVVERGSRETIALTAECEMSATSIVSRAEVAAALARAARTGLLTRDIARRARRSFAGEWQDLVRVPVTEALAERADRELANGIANLVSRVAALVGRAHGAGRVLPIDVFEAGDSGLVERIDAAVARYDLRAATGALVARVADVNRDLEREQPWVLARTAPSDAVAGRRLACQSMAAPISAEMTDAANTAILAASKSLGTLNDCPAMNSDMVKPMPASAPAPASCRQVYAVGFSASASQTAAADANSIPIGLPMTRPAMMASISGSCPAMTLAVNGTPALASAKIGRIR